MNTVKLYIDNDVNLSDMDEYNIIKNIQMIYNTNVEVKRTFLDSKYVLTCNDKYTEALVSEYVENFLN